MTPEGTHLLAFYNTTSSEGSVVKIAAQNGELCWQKQIALEGRVLETGHINEQGDVFLTSGFEGYSIWKSDSECENELGYFQAGRGLEYISTVITDPSGNVYIAGCEGSRPGKGSTCAKLTSDLHLIWEVKSQNTEGKDDYSLDIAVDRLGNVYRVGYDSPDDEQSHIRGRVISHRGNDGEERYRFAVDEPSSLVGGVLADEENCIYLAYSYNAARGTGVPTGRERTVVAKCGLNGNVLWKRDIPYVGILVSRHALRWNADESLLVVFQITVDGESYPALASFSRQGERLWLKIVDRPDWNVTRAGVEVAGTTAFLGLNSTKRSRPNRSRRRASWPVGRSSLSHRRTPEP